MDLLQSGSIRNVSYGRSKYLRSAVPSPTQEENPYISSSSVSINKFEADADADDDDECTSNACSSRAVESSSFPFFVPPIFGFFAGGEKGDDDDDDEEDDIGRFNVADEEEDDDAGIREGRGAAAQASVSNFSNCCLRSSQVLLIARFIR